MFKKALSLIIAIMMMASVAVVGASAAETEAEATAAANTIYFQVPDDWNNYKSIFCHVWAIDGSGSWPAWQSKAEKCKDEGNKLFSYDLSKTKNEIDPAKGVGYAVIFSANTGIQTYNALMSAECIGDTLYCTGNLIENPEDDAKKAIEATWKKHTDKKFGPEKKIASSGNIVGTALPEGSTDATLLATYIVQYLGDTTKTDKLPSIIKALNVTPEEVYAESAKRLADNGDAEADKKKAEIKELLGVKDAPATPNNNSSNNNKPANNNNNNKPSSNNNSTSGSTTTNNGTATGESDTALFIMAGLMILAAGVIFAARKREN